MYKPTSVDLGKIMAQIVIKYANKKSYTIDTNGMEISGRGVIRKHENGWYEVNERKLDELSAQFSTATDF